MSFDKTRELCDRIKQNISGVIVGKETIIERMLIAVLCKGHILLEDVPGTGKTVMAKCLAKSINASFKRIQFTPDLLPSELTGISYFNQKSCDFIFREGPLFSNIVLADEINRATPRTQSSLLECMEERQVSVDGCTYTLETPFFVIATQNPVEIQGTFPLPEAQLDRFFMRLKPGYPTIEEETNILDRFRINSPIEEIGSVAEKQELAKAQATIAEVKINKVTMDYIVRIVDATRTNDKISLGASPRGSIALMRASQAMAVIKGRDFATPDDVKELALPVLSHRIILKGHARSMGLITQETVLAEILNSLEAPVEG